MFFVHAMNLNDITIESTEGTLDLILRRLPLTIVADPPHDYEQMGLVKSGFFSSHPYTSNAKRL